MYKTGRDIMARDFTSNDAKQIIIQLNALQNMQREIGKK